MRKGILAAAALGLALGVPALAAFSGYRLAYLRLRKNPWEVNSLVRDRVETWRINETMAGAFALAKRDLAGVERCYYTAPDFRRVTWIGKDIPTPFVGFAPKPGPLASGRINSLQFRYSRELEFPKPPCVCRVFFIGGSTAYGSGASSNETTIGGYLEDLLNRQGRASGKRFEVVTAAACAWTTTHERILIENRLVELEPDLVVSLSGHNDAYWGAEDRNVEWFRAFQDEYYYTLAHSLLACNFDEHLPAEDPSTGTRVGVAEGVERLRRNVFLAATALDAVGSDYVFALQPVLAMTKKQLTDREAKIASAHDQAGLVLRMDEFRKALRQTEFRRFHFADLTSALDSTEGDYFLDGCHFGDKGNDLIARALAQVLIPILDARARQHVLRK